MQAARLEVQLLFIYSISQIMSLFVLSGQDIVQSFLKWLQSYMIQQQIPPGSPEWKWLKQELLPMWHPLLYRIYSPFSELCQRVSGLLSRNFRQHG